MSMENPRSGLCEILQNTVIPQAVSMGVSRLLLAPPRWKSGMDLPDGMTAVRVALRGKGTKIRGRRPYGSTTLSDTVWREDKLHSLRTPVLCFVVQGPVACQINDYVLHCDTMHAFLLPPGIPYADGSHRFLDESKTRQGKCSRLQIQPYHGGLCCWLTDNWLNDAGEPQYNEQSYSLPDSRVPDYLYQLLEEMQERQFDWEVICDGILRILLGTLHRELRDSPVLEAGNELLIANSKRPHPALPQIEEYIQQNLARKITTEKMAYRAAMSRTAFTRQFRARTGKSLVEYLIDLRLEKARDLLEKSDLAVEQIAGAVGFTPDRLRVLFRQYEGIAPSQYRQKRRGNSRE
jgi:AraC-like DNA-binding protein